VIVEFDEFSVMNVFCSDPGYRKPLNAPHARFYISTISRIFLYPWRGCCTTFPLI